MQMKSASLPLPSEEEYLFNEFLLLFYRSSKKWYPEREAWFIGFDVPTLQPLISIRSLVICRAELAEPWSFPLKPVQRVNESGPEESRLQSTKHI